jgi:PAS domain S-box-containing protein
MKKDIPIKDISIDITDEELFFSITNSRGFIQLANTIFSKISGYSVEELKGAPHSIIRHPDMPKTIFKVMWETIKGGYPFGGYIKNLTSDGRYYWVYALVLPVENRFLSIRLKPRVQSLQAIERLYQRLCNIEQNSAVAAETELNHWLLARDFITYHTWASSCLSAEIDANIGISSRAFPDQLARLSFRPASRTDLVASHTLNQVFKGYKFLHRNVIDWLKRVDHAIEMFYEFQAILMVLNRELSKKARSIRGIDDKIDRIHEESLLMNNYRGNLRFFFETLKKMQFHRSSVLLHLSSMNTFVSHFFDYLKSESSADIPVSIDSLETIKILTQSLLLFPKLLLQDQDQISNQIKNHFEYVDLIVKTCEEGQVRIDNVKDLILESKEKGLALLQHYDSFSPQTLSDANSFYQLLIGGELVLEGVARYKT